MKVYDAVVKVMQLRNQNFSGAYMLSAGVKILISFAHYLGIQQVNWDSLPLPLDYSRLDQIVRIAKILKKLALAKIQIIVYAILYRI